MTYRVDPLAFVNAAAQHGRSRHVPPNMQDRYALVPLSMLGQDAPVLTPQPVPASGASDVVKKIVAAVIVLAVVIAIIEAVRRQMAGRSSTPVLTRNKAVKRLSTAQLAKTLYDRLDKKGNASQATLRSLQAYARRA